MSGGGGGRDDGFGGGGATGGGGTGGGGGPGGGGGGGEEDERCDIVQSAPLNSPQPGVADKLSVGEQLFVRLSETGARPVLEVRDAAGRLAGALTHRGHVSIIRCIGDGWSYSAIVTSTTGGLVILRIQPA
ncbi:hypothetical protein ACWKWJ_10900 [Sphingopyxis terrae subsp. ummariensis]